MSSTSTGMQQDLLLSFRTFAREIRNPTPYRFGVSEFKGGMNVIIGLGQLLVCPYFKLVNNGRLYEVHIEAGKTALKQGLKDLAPAIVTTTVIVSGVAAKRWMQS